MRTAWPMARRAAKYLLAGLVLSFLVGVVGVLVSTPLAAEPVRNVAGYPLAFETFSPTSDWIWMPPADWPQPTAIDIRANWVASHRTVWSDAERFPNFVRINEYLVGDIGGEPRFRQTRLSCGWPAPMFRSELSGSSYTRRVLGRVFEWDLSYSPRFRAVHIARHPSDPSPLFSASLLNSKGRDIPMMPYWPGMLANAALFGIACWGVCSLPRICWQAIRRMRGLCVACGYDITGLERCSECGRVVVEPARRESISA